MAQQPIKNEHNVVTIIGDPSPLNSTALPDTDIDKSTPPIQKKTITAAETISPSLENGFHARFNINTNIASSSETLSPSTRQNVGNKSKKHKKSFTEYHFNIKKRLKSWISKSKKKYRPNICNGM